MDLKLIVRHANQAPSQVLQELVVGASGCSIGRANTNQCQLSNLSISGVHANITVENGSFFVIDLSSNGTYLNYSKQRLPKSQPTPIKPGDVISMFDMVTMNEQITSLQQSNPNIDINQISLQPQWLYHITVEAVTPIQAAQPPPPSASVEVNQPSFLDELGHFQVPATPPAAVPGFKPPNVPIAEDNNDPFGLSNLFQSTGASAPFEKENNSNFSFSNTDDTDPLKLLNSEEPNISQSVLPVNEDKWWEQESNEQAFCLGDHVDIANIADNETMPENPGNTQTVQSAANVRHGHNDIYAEFAKVLMQKFGVGESNHEALNSLADEITATVDIMVERLHALMQGRTAMRAQLDTDATRIQPADNNPLKFCNNSEEAKECLFNAQNDGFMCLSDSVEESLSDLYAHEMAVLSGIQEAYMNMLSAFSPENIVKMNSKSALLPVKGMQNAVNWENYCDYYKKLIADPDYTYSKLFGRTFSDAYERRERELGLSVSLKRTKR